MLHTGTHRPRDAASKNFSRGHIGRGRTNIAPQVQAWPTHYNSELSLCSAGGHSYDALLKVFRDGMVLSGAQYPRDALSKGCNIQEFSVGDKMTLHRKQEPHLIKESVGWDE